MKSRSNNDNLFLPSLLARSIVSLGDRVSCQLSSLLSPLLDQSAEIARPERNQKSKLSVELNSINDVKTH